MMPPLSCPDWVVISKNHIPLWRITKVMRSSDRRPRRFFSRFQGDMLSFMPDSSVVSDVTPSANFDERRGGREPDMILLHYTGMATAAAAIERLCTTGTEVSSHY